MNGDAATGELGGSAAIRFPCTPGARSITGETIHADCGWYVNIA